MPAFVPFWSANDMGRCGRNLYRLYMCSIPCYSVSDVPLGLFTRREFISSGIGVGVGVGVDAANTIVGWRCGTSGDVQCALYLHPDYNLTLLCLGVYLYCLANDFDGWFLTTGSRSTQAIIWNAGCTGLGVEYWGWDFLTPSCH